METLTGGPENYIFFLQLSDELQDEYLQLSHYFKRWGITLLPVLPVQLAHMAEKDRHHVLSYLPDHRSHDRFNLCFKRYLKMGMLSKKYCLHQLSSFGKLESSHQFERMKSYYHYRLPLDAQEFVQQVVKQFYLEKRDNRRWPGTKRGRLPSLVVGN